MLSPTTEVDLSNSLFGRNVWFKINNQYNWALSGNSPHQFLTNDSVSVNAGYLFHEVVRTNSDFETKIKSFVVTEDNLELHHVELINKSGKSMTIKPTIAIPVYGRSADSLRDHRHVTSLLNRAYVVNNGIINRPSLSFDERGHLLNDISYGVFGRFGKGKVINYWPNFDEFIGTSSLLLPDVIKNDLTSSHKTCDVIAGYEVMAGLEAEEIEIQNNETYTLKFALAIGKSNQEIIDLSNKYLDGDFDFYLKENQNYWNSILNKLEFNLISDEFSNWLNWVRIQPVLRRIFGNSFLPHHDYGRGGRGWRDLWQDQLALILMDDAGVKENLINNFAGIRLDGSNATIIGSNLGEFVADRNSIVRVWSDHGCWGLFTVKLYLDYSGDLDFLFINQTYFKDKFSHYTKKVSNFKYKENFQLDDKNQIYRGTILEHLLIQNLIPFFNLGKHGMIRLEDADWNDGLDMAHDEGETVAFTAFYASNLILLSDILEKLNTDGVDQIELFEEIKTLLICNINDSIKEKKSLLNIYFSKVEDKISGNKFSITTKTLSNILRNMGNNLLNKIREQEWKSSNDLSYFNGYYDNDSVALDNPRLKHMELTAQVFTILSKASTNEMVEEQIKAADELLYSDSVGGFKLNTDFKDIKTNLGRLFGFAYGNKENGSMFSHMAIMYSYALLDRGFVDVGIKVIKSIYNLAIDTKRSNIYPGIPEYFNLEGRGMYHFLTGSASWLILTMVTQVYGIKGIYGKLFFEPKLKLEAFINHEVSILKVFKNNLVKITYLNKDNLNYGEYVIESIICDGELIAFTHYKEGVLLQFYPKKEIKIILGKKGEKGD